MPIPQLTPFPDPPRIYQPEEEFDARADEMAGHLPVLVNEINAMAEAVNTELANIDDATTAAVNAANAANASKNAAATSATGAATSEANALASKNAAATSATNASISAVYAKNRIDHVITQNGLTLDANDATQLQKAIVNATKLLGGANFGARGCIFMGRSIIAGSDYTPAGDFTKITKHANFSGAGYLHLKLHGLSVESMPFIDINGHEYGANNYISELAVAYLFGASGGVYHQKFTNNTNTPFFYYSSAQSAYMLRIKINSAYYLLLRLDAMDAVSANPVANLNVTGGMFTPLTVEAI